MDEILIEDKKYISSKRAAKITGYAKDYVGQLCREGRVPARLVGRSWYVLDSAIQDHRFGNQQAEPKKVSAPPVQVRSSAWDVPRYEALPPDALPVINKVQEAQIQAPRTPMEPISPATETSLQDSWKAWFNRVADTNVSELPVIVPPEPEHTQFEDSMQQEIDDAEEVNVPIHTYQSPPEELLPKKKNVVSADEPAHEQEIYTRVQKHGPNGGIWKFRLVVAVLSIAVIAIAVLNTGYFDSYILSNISDKDISQLPIGLEVYNK